MNQIQIMNKYCTRKQAIPRNKVVESKKKYNRKKANWKKECRDYEHSL